MRRDCLGRGPNVRWVYRCESRSGRVIEVPVLAWGCFAADEACELLDAAGEDSREYGLTLIATEDA